MMDGRIYFNNDNSANFGLIRLDDGESETPDKKKVLVDIPFLNGSYDFSDIYGETSYEDRVIVYEFALDPLYTGVKSCKGIENRLNALKISIENWLMSANTKVKLIDSYLSGYYYMAECEKIDFDNRYTGAFLTVTFKAYPFKIREVYEGENLWDGFNFELDILQDTKFTVNGTSNVDIYNSSIIDIEPTIIASSEFEIIKDSKKFIVEAGESKDYRFKFKKGENNITLKGNGTIEFRFRKEVL